MVISSNDDYSLPVIIEAAANVTMRSAVNLTSASETASPPVFGASGSAAAMTFQYTPTPSSSKSSATTPASLLQLPLSGGRPTVFRKNKSPAIGGQGKRLSRGQILDAVTSTTLGAGAAVSSSAGATSPNGHQPNKRPIWQRITKTNGEKTWTALYDYEAEQEDELTLRRGTEVRVLSKAKRVSGGKGWWTGMVNNQVGVFPSTYVVEVPRDAQQPSVSSAAAGRIGNSTARNSVLANSRFQLRPPEIEFAELEKKELIGQGAFGKVYRSIYRGEEVNK
jgi:hypothetical protein